jgi:hypothetical protein
VSEWVAVSLLDGEIIVDVPMLEVEAVSASMGRYETTTGSLPIVPGKVSPEWRRATTPWASALVLLDDNPLDPAHGIPVWGGIVTRRSRNETDRADLDLVTAEGYFDRVYVGDETFAAVPQCTIAETLIEEYAGAAGGGIPLRVEIVGDVGQERDRTYLDRDDKTLYAIVRDLAGIINGIEWFIGWEWQFAPDRLTPVVYLGDRVGLDVTEGLAPAAVFDLPGSVRTFEFIEDYGHGRGANDIMATSSGEGELRPQSERQVYVDPLRPRLEYRWTPSTSITETATLDGHAERRLPEMRNGTQAIGLDLNLSTAPKLGVDWGIGDTVGIDLGGIAADGREQLPAFPGGLEGNARVAGWSRVLTEPQAITPFVVAETGAFDG